MGSKVCRVVPCGAHLRYILKPSYLSHVTSKPSGSLGKHSTDRWAVCFGEWLMSNGSRSCNHDLYMFDLTHWGTQSTSHLQNSIVMCNSIMRYLDIFSRVFKYMCSSWSHWCQVNRWWWSPIKRWDNIIIWTNDGHAIPNQYQSLCLSIALLVEHRCLN